MNHDALIEQLAGNVKATKPLHINSFMARIGVLWLAIVLVILASIGLRDDFGHMASISKPAYFALYGLLLSVGLFLSAMPARNPRPWVWASATLIAASIGLFAAEFAQYGVAMIEDAMARPNSLACLLSVGLFGLVPLYWIMRWLKMAAPMHPTRAGMAAGAISGALAAAAYGLHCQQDAVAYIGIWYVAPILGHVALGAVIGRNYLRW